MYAARALAALFLPLAMLWGGAVGAADTSSKCPGEKGYFFTNYYDKLPRPGGFVSNSADVDVTARIAATAAVCGSASVLDNARIYGHAVIAGEAIISGDARVFGDARVEGNAIVRDLAAVSGKAIIKGDAIVGGRTQIRDAITIRTGEFGVGDPLPPPEDSNKLVQTPKQGASQPETRSENPEQRYTQQSCYDELREKCATWERCETLVQGECAKRVVNEMNKALDQCHSHGFATNIQKTDEGFYKRFIFLGGEKVICNSEAKEKRIASELEAEKKKRHAFYRAWCASNPLSLIETRAEKCFTRCEQVTGFKKIPREYYDKCTSICANNKTIRLSRFDERCQAE